MAIAVALIFQFPLAGLWQPSTYRLGSHVADARAAGPVTERAIVLATLGALPGLALAPPRPAEPVVVAMAGPLPGPAGPAVPAERWDRSPEPGSGPDRPSRWVIVDSRTRGPAPTLRGRALGCR